MENMQDYNDVLILGILCEVLCKIEVPLKALQENANLVEQFVDKSFEYCGYAAYHFSLELPQEVIDYLTIGRDIEGMLTAAGFEFEDH